MTQKFQVLIVGGGNAGLSAAAQLLRKNKQLNIGILEPSAKHYYQPAWTLAGAGVFDIKKTEKNEADYIPKGATWIKEAVTEFFPENNEVVTNKGNRIGYDYLIVCPGIQLDWQKIEGLRENMGRNSLSCNYDFNTAPYTWEMIKNFKGGTAIFTNPATPIKCGGAPHKIMYLAVDYWRKKGILDKCDVHYLSGVGAIFAVKEYADTLTGVVNKGNIQTHFNVVVNKIDAANRQVYYTEKSESGETVTKSMHYDLCHSVPPQSAPDFIKKSPLADAQNPYGYIEINKGTMQHVRYANIFAAGDCTNAPCSKTGAAIRKQVPVVVANILSLMQNQQAAQEYNGYSACPIPTEYGKLMLAEFDYSNKPTMTFPFDQTKPRWSMWFLKKSILPWLYWNKILRGKA